MLDLNENKIKKNWLYTLIVSFIWSSFISIASLVKFHSSPHSIYSKNMFVFTLLFQTFITLGLFYIYYRCAYKKPGRKLLVFHLVVIIICYIYTIPYHLNLLPFAPKAIQFSSFYDNSIFLISLPFSVVMFVLNLRLFKLNGKIKLRLIEASKKD